MNLLTPTELRQRAARIRLLVLDVDGVLTDGRLYFTAEGESQKVFHVRDGAGIVLLRRAGIDVAIISGRNSAAVNARMRELNVKHVQQGVHDKQAALENLLQQVKLDAEQVACMGDDTPDLIMLDKVALAIAVADAHPTVRAAAHWVTQTNGGLGAVREACDLILDAQAASRSDA